MYIDPNEQLYMLLEENPQLRKTLIKCWRNGDTAVANEVIDSLNVHTTIEIFMEYLSMK